MVLLREVVAIGVGSGDVTNPVSLLTHRNLKKKNLRRSVMKFYDFVAKFTV